MTVKFKKNKNGTETLIYSKNMSTQDCINVINKRVDKRFEEMKIYEIFYKKYLNLQKKQDEDLNWLRYLKNHPSFIEDNKDKE